METLRENMVDLKKTVRKIDNIEIVSGDLSNAIVSVFHSNCPHTVKKTGGQNVNYTSEKP